MSCCSATQISTMGKFSNETGLTPRAWWKSSSFIGGGGRSLDLRCAMSPWKSLTRVRRRSLELLRRHGVGCGNRLPRELLEAIFQWRTTGRADLVIIDATFTRERTL